MLAAVLDDTPYRIVYFLHLLSVIVGMGMAFGAPIMAVRARKSGSESGSALVQEGAAAVVFPSLLLAGVFGGALVGLSQDIYDFQQTWLAIGGAIWMLGLVFAYAAYPPSWLKLMTFSPVQQRAAGGLLHLSLAVMLVLMTWKFGV